MPTKPEKITLNHDFGFSSDADLDAQIAAFRAAHEQAHAQSTGERLAMDARRSLGPNKVRITFRIISIMPGKPGKRR